MLIGELARRAGTTAKTLRFYEHEGLLPEPARTPSGYRDYLPDVVERVVFIRDAQAAGFTLRQIGQILGIRDGGQPPCEHVGQLIDQRLGELVQRIAELEQARAHLYELARRTRELDPPTVACIARSFIMREVDVGLPITEAVPTSCETWRGWH